MTPPLPREHADTAPWAASLRGRPLRLRRAIAIGALALAPPVLAGAQDPARAQPSPLAPRDIRGRVVTPAGDSATRGVPGAWVTLHRVGPDSSGPIDSVRTDAAGRYAMRYHPAASEPMYFASTLHGGVAYFTAPLRAGDVSGDEAEIMVFDTTSSPLPIGVRGRHMIVSGREADGRRTIVEVFDLSNDTTVTRVAGSADRPTFSTIVPPGATNFEVGRSDIVADAVSLRDGRVFVFAPLAPGMRQLAFSYSLPASGFPLRIPLTEGAGMFEVLVEEPGLTVSGARLAEQQPVSLEGRSFRRLLAENVPTGAVVTFTPNDPPGATASRFAIPVAVAAFAMVGALMLALTRRRRVRAPAGAAVGGTVGVGEPRPAGGRVNTAAMTDADRLAREIAELDDAFALAAAPDEQTRDAYTRRRAELKARLSALLASENGRT